RLALRRPARGIQHGGVRRVEHEIGDAGRVVPEQHLAPRLAAVGRLVDATVRVGAESVALGANPDGVWTARVHTDPGDLVSVLQPHMRPGLPAVARLPDAVAVGDVAADGVLAR